MPEPTKQTYINSGAWSGWAKRNRDCRECPEPILKGQEVIRVSGKTTTGRWFRSIWHFDCWVVQAHRYNDEHPYVAATGHPGKGRPSFNLTPEQQLRRRALITRFSRLGDKKRAAIDLGLMSKLDYLQHEGQEIMKSMKELGGVPKSWLG